MNDAEIEILKQAVKSGDTVLWCPDDSTARCVCHVGPVKTLEGEEPELGECAFFVGGHHAALYNCELREFVVGHRLGVVR